MIATWVVYSAAIGFLIGVGALLGERAARALHIPVRLVWVAGCLLTLVGPIAAYVIASHRVHAAVAVGPELVGGSITLPASANPASPEPTRLLAVVAALGSIARHTAAFLDRPLLIGWAIATLLLLARLGWSMGQLRHRRQRWASRDVDGTHVLISRDIGPAVVGLRSMQIVMPEWLLSLDAPLRAVVLQHEEEHRRAGDPYVLFLATIACALVPWHLALWWQARRLRLAVEIDCDTRVLRNDPHVDRYGMLLLAIAQRGNSRVYGAVAALTEGPSDLERRIDAMTNPVPRSRVVPCLCAGGAVIALLVACAAPTPDAPTRTNAELPATTLAAVSPPTVQTPAEIAKSSGTHILVHHPTDVRQNPCGNEADKPGGRESQTAKAITKPVNPAPSFYYDCEVDALAYPAEGNRAPTYPSRLRVHNIEGSVLASFVVDTNGRADMSTFTVIKTTHDLFTDAVREQVPNFRFVPAQLDGHKVAEAVQMPFLFTLNKTDDGSASPGRLAEAKPKDDVQLAISLDSFSRASTRDVTMSVVLDTGSNDNGYYDFQVEKAVTPAQGNTAPSYPAALRAANVEGRVLVSFVVDTLGHALMPTFKVIKATHDLFTAAVRDHLPAMTFVPAELHGRKVKQLVQMPFVFTLGK